MRAYVERSFADELIGGSWFDTNTEAFQWVDGYLRGLRDAGARITQVDTGTWKWRTHKTGLITLRKGDK